MAKLKRRVKGAKTTEKREVSSANILDLAEKLKAECAKRKCNCPLFDEDALECKLTKGGLCQPCNWDI